VSNLPSTSSDGAELNDVEARVSATRGDRWRGQPEGGQVKPGLEELARDYRD
jgi:hypothetical protein